MSSLTIHALDETLDQRLNEEAQRKKKSKNQLVKELLAHSLGMPEAGRYADDYREFCGAWTAAECEAFESSQAGNRQAETEDWRA
jgi:hypothetical protein